MVKKRSTKGGKKPKPNQTNPFEWKNKPYVHLTELERKRAADEMGRMLEEPMLTDARDAQGALLVAAAVLVLSSGEARLLHDGDEWGDGEGSILAEHTVAIAERALKQGESVRLDLVEVRISSDGTCSCTVSAGKAAEHEQVDDILTPSLKSTLEAARRRSSSEDADYWLVVLTTASGAKRIAYADQDDGVGEARGNSADFVRRARRVKWLKPGESIDRTLLKLRLSGTRKWTALATADPVPLSGSGR